MRERANILSSLERVYREALSAAQQRGEKDVIAKYDLDFQRDQLRLEVLLDIRELVSPHVEAEPEPSLLDRAQALRSLTRKR